MYELWAHAEWQLVESWKGWVEWLKIYNACMKVHDEHLSSLLQIYTPY
jgi:hypothetical protein